jgi:hypothetical protein
MELLGRDGNYEAHLPCICCKVKSRTSPERSVIPLDQNSASVWNFWWTYTPLFDMIFFSSFCFETWLSYSSISLHVLIIFNTFGDLHVSPLFFYTLGPSCVPFFNTFCIALPSLSRNKLERSNCKTWGFYFGGDGKHVLAYSWCRNSYLFVACT